MKDKLLPCPWCREIPVIDDYSCGWHVWCANEDCMVQPDLKRGYHIKEDAIEAWNTRWDQGEDA